MAERTATRSSNRLNTPQSPPKVHQAGNVPQQTASRRTTRATRSQSRDVSDSEAGKRGGKGGRRGARQANAGSATGRKGRNKAQESSAQADPNLSVVPEETRIQYPDLKPSLLNGIAQAANQATDSPYSAFSGTTARTSRSAHELSASSAFDLLDALPDLSYAADKVLSWLVPENDVSEEAIRYICDELQNNESRTRKNVFRLGKSFEMQKEVYGAEAFINPSIILGTLLGSNEVQGTGTESWRPDPLLHKANLTTLVILITRPWEVSASARLVEFLDQNFPTVFIGRMSNTQDFAVALEIRTQHFILQLTRYIHELNFDPDMLLSQVFQNNPTTFKGWNSLGLQAEELSDDQKQAIANRFHELGQNFSDGKDVDPEALRGAYPWIPFVTNMMTWSKARLEEVEIQVNAQGGTDELIHALDQEIHQRVSAGLIGNDVLRTDNQPEYPSPSQLANTTSDKIEAHRIATIKAASKRTEKLRRHSAKTLGLRVAHLKEMEKSAKKTPASSSSPAPHVSNSPYGQQFTAAVAPMGTNSLGGPAPTANMIPMSTSAPTFDGPFTGTALMDGNWQPQQIEDNMQPNMEQVSFEDDLVTSQQIVQMGEEREAAANKENVADAGIMQVSTSPGGSQRQVLGPRKMRLIDPQPGAQRVTFESQGFQDMPGSSRGTKRNFDVVDMEAEGNELEEPSQDQGFQQDNRAFDVAARRAQKPARAPQRRTKKARASQATEPIQDFVEPETATYDGDGPPSSNLNAYQRSKSLAQEVTASQPKKVQVRKAWTDEETGLLLDLIEEHGTSWRLLKQIDLENDHVLKDRDQVALKDKARNMKLDFLKAGTFLPQNFAHVPLNKLQIQKLTDLGLEYNQDQGRRRRQNDNN